MKLYKVLVRHCAPKDCLESIAGYVFANNTEEVYKYVDKKFNYGMWEDRYIEMLDDGEYCAIYNDEYEEIGQESYREKMIRIGGEFYDENADYSDAFYGVTHYGWEEVEEEVDNFSFAYLLDSGIAKVVS